MGSRRNRIFELATSSVAALTVGVLASSILTQPRPDLSVTRQGDEILVQIGDDVSIGALLEACAPFLDRRIHADRDLYWFREEVSSDVFSVRPEELWTRLQPHLANAGLVWVPGGEGSVLLLHPGRPGADIIGHAPFVPVEELLARSPHWAGQSAMIITTAVPLRSLGARMAFASLRSYFTRQKAHLTPIDDANALVLTERAPAVLEMARVIHELDELSAPSGKRFRIYPIETADLGVVAAHIDALTARLQPARSVPPPRQAPVVALPLSDRGEILLHADAKMMALVDELIEELDGH